MTPSDLPDRLADKIAIALPSGCWTWLACKNKAGYGRVALRGETAQAHRLIYSLVVDPELPVMPGGPHNGLQLDHLCRNRSCVNPDHLEPVTHAENNRRKPKAVAA